MIKADAVVDTLERSHPGGTQIWFGWGCAA